MADFRFGIKNKGIIHIVLWLGLLVVAVYTIYNFTRPAKRTITPAYYHWKTVFNPTAKAVHYLDSIGVKKLYVRVFDVDWDETGRTYIPKAVIKWSYEFGLKQTVCPSFFITNQTFEKIPDSAVEKMAERVWNKIFLLTDSIPELTVTEIMADCDWSPPTREKYFRFLKALKSHFPPSIRLNVTIRLHQVKYFKMTGVPPADAGTLMFYNMTDIRDEKTANSILDLEIAKKYLVNFEKYPLPLHVVLPVFSWGVILRNGKVAGMINDFVTDTNLTTDNLRELRVKNSHYHQGVYLYKGDQVRLETIDYTQLTQSAIMLSPLLKTKKLTVGFYHLSEENRNRFPSDKITSILEQFAK